MYSTRIQCRAIASVVLRYASLPDWKMSSVATDVSQIAEIDHTFPLEFRRRAEDIMIEIKATYHIQVFSGVTHGFALRGNVDDPIASEYRKKL